MATRIPASPSTADTISLPSGRNPKERVTCWKRQEISSAAFTMPCWMGFTVSPEPGFWIFQASMVAVSLDT